MTYLATADVTLHFADHPAVTPDSVRPFDAVILIHGWCCDSTDWAPLIDGLVRHARVVTLDLRGCGRSGTSATGYRVSHFAGDIVALLTHLGIARAVLIGHSAGAEIAVTLAVGHPELVFAVVTVDPAYGVAPTERSRVQQVADELAGSEPNQVLARYFAGLDSRSTPAELRARHLQSALSCRPDVAHRMFADINLGASSWHFRPETDAFLRQLRAPLLAIYRNDTRAAAGHPFRTRPNDDVLVYPGTGHWPHQEQPRRFVRDVTAWLDTLPFHHLTEGYT